MTVGGYPLTLQTTIKTILPAVLILMITGTVFVLPSPAHGSESAPIIELEYDIINTQNHPTNLFTQGLLVDGAWIYESSGGYGQSVLARYKASDTSLLTQMPLAKNIFAEGLTLLADKFYLLTWRAGKMLVFDRNWNRLASHNYNGEGWGLTSDGQYLIMSDGSDKITFYQPEPFKAVRSIKVNGANRRWSAINELEYANGVLWANRWFSDEVLAIDPSDGSVIAKLDFSQIAKQHRVGKNAREKVLNGLAWSEQHRAMWLTGKNWDRRYLVKIPATHAEIIGLAAER